MPFKKLSLNKVYTWALMAVATVGLLDATVLTQQHYSGKVLPCNITSGCETVLSSKYSVVAGVPLALLGMVFYFSVLAMAVYYLQTGHAMLKKLLLAAGTVGFLSSLGLVYIQGAVLHAWCQYCLLSALSSTVIFILSILLFTTKQEVHHEEA